MKKIIAVFDALRFSESTMEHAIYLAHQYNASITGIFLTESNRLSYSIYEGLVEQSVPGRKLIAGIEKADSVSMTESIQTFESNCRAVAVKFSVQRIAKKGTKELLHAALFADLLVIDADETFSYVEGELPGAFIKTILHDANCPVMVVPKKFRSLKKLMFLYDGSPSSIYTIKMLSYTFPEMKMMPATLLFSKKGGSALQLPDSRLVKEWLKEHYPNAASKVLTGGEKQLVTTIEKESQGGALIIMGAYNRGTLSMWAHKSLADSLMNEMRNPLFIAHSRI